MPRSSVLAILLIQSSLVASLSFSHCPHKSRCNFIPEITSVRISLSSIIVPSLQDTMTGGLSLENLEFHYVSRPNHRVLDGFKLPVAPGQTVALVGASGCGKSTTAQLVQRFYDVDSGALVSEGFYLLVLLD